jgi:hypothetical protein
MRLREVGLQLGFRTDPYYRYHRGFNKLYEEEQQWIDGLFRRYGYTAPRVYDNYRTSWKY